MFSINLKGFVYMYRRVSSIKFLYIEYLSHNLILFSNCSLFTHSSAKIKLNIKIFTNEIINADWIVMYVHLLICHGEETRCQWIITAHFHEITRRDAKCRLRCCLIKRRSALFHNWTNHVGGELHNPASRHADAFTRHARTQFRHRVQLPRIQSINKYLWVARACLAPRQMHACRRFTSMTSVRGYRRDCISSFEIWKNSDFLISQRMKRQNNKNLKT